MSFIAAIAPLVNNSEENEAFATYIRLWQVAHVLEIEATRHLLQHNLTSSQFSVLGALFALGPLNQRQLAQYIQRSTGNLTLVIDNLERAGLVSRQRSQQDRRAMVVSLTEPGETLIRQIMPQHVLGVQELFGALGPQEIAQLRRLLRKLGQALEQGPETSPR